MRVICTAGHVDHGKSTLVQAISGINPDRLREEQEREMTIDLGFAWITLPDGERVGIVDVPGHEDFIENMLAGIGGLDAVLLIVAADEGIMPQTREHLAILQLMGMNRGVVALTKCDAAESEEWIEVVELEVMEMLHGTPLEDLPIVRVSAHTGRGLDPLIATLTDILKQQPPRADDGEPVLPIDRVFTMSGFGTVVTGTLSGGTLSVGQKVVIQPQGLEARIRGLQAHEETVETAYPGSRTAINLAGVDKSQLKRGDVVTLEGLIHPTLLFDAIFDHLPGSTRPLKHNAEVKVFVGPSESSATIRLLDADVLKPGQRGYVQFQLKDDLPIRSGQRFVVRIPSPPETIGGGRVLDTSPGRKWKRNNADVLERFDVLAHGDPALKLAYELKNKRVPQPINEYPESVKEKYGVYEFEGYLVHPEAMRLLEANAVRLLDEFHAQNPLLMGIDPPELLRRLRLNEDDTIVLEVLAAKKVLDYGRWVKLPGKGMTFTKAQRQAVNELLVECDANPYSPPSYKDAAKKVSDEVLKVLLAQGELIYLRPDVLLRPAAYQAMLDYARERLEKGEGLTVAGLRDHFDTSRRIALPFLDYLEAQNITRRVDDKHVLKSANWDAVKL